jgi:hypothetical protein
MEPAKTNENATSEKFCDGEDDEFYLSRGSCCDDGQNQDRDVNVS